MLDYGSTRFLIVDDFSDFRNSLKAMLRDMGARDVDTADRGETAIHMCRSKRYDVILHDYNLGSGKTGQQVLEELVSSRLISHHSMFVMVTAESSQAMVLSALEHEPDAYLTKPFNRASLDQRLVKLAERKRALKGILQALDKQDPDGVLSACQQLAQQDKRYVSICQRYQATALRELGRLDELDALLKGVLAERMLPWAQTAMASLLQQRGELSGAQQLYEQGLKQFPLLPALHDGLAAVFLAQGDGLRAQQSLENAVKLAPLALGRQLQLAKLAMANQDFSCATKAFRQAMEQGRTSKFRTPESYLGFAQALTSQVAEGGLDKRMQQDISHALSELDKVYSGDAQVQVRSRLATAVTAHKAGDRPRAEQLLNEVAKSVQDNAQVLSAEAALNVASQLRDVGKAAASDALLRSCVEIYGDDPQVMKGVAEQTNNGEILRGGEEAIELNRQGVRCYQQKHYADALELFRQAYARAPKNISIALNTAQSLLQIGADKISPEWLQECRNCLSGISQIPSSNSHYARYQQLKQRACADE
jgi:DNA-binding response OmpR family regulator/cytochrome c-type biogenesis protein CcmH/NrfG